MEARFDFAKEEFFSEEDDDRKVKLIYAYYGLAIYLGQSLEETFTLMLWTHRIFKKKVKSNEEINEIIDAIYNSKKTMGNLINEVKTIYNLTVEHVERVDRILQTRNYLIHSYFKFHIEKFHSITGQLEMIKYFCDFIDESQKIDSEFKAYYNKYVTTLGFTDEKINSLMQEIKLEERKRDE